MHYLKKCVIFFLYKPACTQCFECIFCGAYMDMIIVFIFDGFFKVLLNVME